MKRLTSSDSLVGLVPISPPTGDQSRWSSHVYGRDYRNMFDDERSTEECGQTLERKKRLSLDQVKALEKNFEDENKLGPDRKAKLANELALQPRQVAVWFQNRRARWKTKQLERDYVALKANFDALKCNFDSVRHENDALVKEIQEVKSKLKEGNQETTISVKEEPIVSETNGQLIEQAITKPLSINSPSECDQPKNNPNYDSYNNRTSVFKGGASDSSDSSAIFNNEDSSSPNAAMSSSSLLRFTAMRETDSCQFFDSKTILGDAHAAYQSQFVKIEEHNFFSDNEACNFFSDNQVPTLQWDCSDQWS